MIKIANAPCSWGALEFDLQDKPATYDQVLDEIKETGYLGTELGDWGVYAHRSGKIESRIPITRAFIGGSFRVGFCETTVEIGWLLSLTDPALVGLSKSPIFEIDWFVITTGLECEIKVGNFSFS